MFDIDETINNYIKSLTKGDKPKLPDLLPEEKQLNTYVNENGYVCVKGWKKVENEQIIAAINQIIKYLKWKDE